MNTLLSILLVEDEPDVRNYLKRALERVVPGACVCVADDGMAALELFASRPLHLIISDHHMPRMTGLELLTHVRTINPGLPFLLISADMTIEARALAAGVSLFLVKPVGFDQLRETITSLLPAPGTEEVGNGDSCL